MAQAQVPTDITRTAPGSPGALGTTVNTVGGTVHEIGGGTVSGTNLFHSFDTFTVGTNHTASFLNTDAIANPSISNILARVLNAASTIDGTISTTNFTTTAPSVNLYLLNPRGILFGRNASLDVNGSFAAATADYIRLADPGGGIFYANTMNASVLTTASPVAFGFLNPPAAGITVQGATLAVQPGQSLSLVGGDITVQADPVSGTPASLSAPGGEIRLASGASAGEFVFGSLTSGPNINGGSFGAMGTITVEQGATVDVSANAAGTVRILGGQFVIADATISADTNNANGAPVAVDINVTEDLSITDTRGVPAITARTTGTGDAGEVRINSGNLTASTTFVDPFFAPTFLINSHTESTGRGGNVTITTGDLTVRNLADPLSNVFTFIESGTGGSGQGGDVTINADSITLDWTGIATGDSIAGQFFPDASGSAGNLTINADSLNLNSVVLTTEAFVSFLDTQAAGDMTWNVREINLKDSAVHTGGMARGGAITFTNFDSLMTDFSFFETWTVFGPGGGITANGRSIELTNGSKFVATTFGDGDAGGISLTASDHVTLSGQASANPNPFSVFSPTGLFSNSFGDVGLGNLGASGDVGVATPRLIMDTGGRINAITNSSGRGGNVTINADAVSIAGEFTGPFHVIEGTIVDIGDFRPSGIFTRTIGTDASCAGPCGDGGNITANIGALFMGPGSQFDAGTSSTGAGGNITAIAGESITISDGAGVSVSSTGPADAGNIFLSAVNRFLAQNSSVTATAAQAGGGDIKIQTAPTGTVQLTNSTISTSVLGGAGGGGDVNIDPQFVILQNSSILAQAFTGPGGNITINGNVVLIDPSSVVSASSQLGINGQVNINAPIQNISGTVAPLPKTFQSATALLGQRCAARASEGQFSTFVVAGRETAPVEPGGLLPSPAGLGGPVVATSGAKSGLFASAAPRPDDLGTAPLRLAALEEACTR
jgi:filamentous hemagglutinin family protein